MSIYVHEEPTLMYELLMRCCTRVPPPTSHTRLPDLKVQCSRIENASLSYYSQQLAFMQGPQQLGIIV